MANNSAEPASIGCPAEVSCRVLGVDDEPAVREVVTDLLAYEGFDVDSVGDAESALKRLAQDHFDLLLTDLKMPGFNGIELIKRVREQNRDIATVLFTGFGTVETAIEAMKEGAFDYVLKPFKPDDMMLVLRRALERQRLERENLSLRETLGIYELTEALGSAMPVQDQLSMIATLARERLAADSVSIVVASPSNGASFATRVRAGRDDVIIDPHRGLAALSAGDAVRAHGAEATGWLRRPPAGAADAQSLILAPLTLRGATFGLISAYRQNTIRGFTEGQRKGLTVLGGKAAGAIETSRMYDDLAGTLTQTMEGFARALEAKDAYTHGHSDRVAQYSRLIAKAMRLPDVEVDRIQHGGLMHDIGKIGIHAGELNKAQKLTPDDYQMFKSHPEQGKRILEPINFLVHLVPCVYAHHEAWDGSGYPQGLDGQGIPLEARILAVADTYDAMTSNRPYRKALPHKIAIAELRRCANRQFDPDVVHAFLDAIGPYREQRQSCGLGVPY